MAFNEKYYKSIGCVLESNDYTEQSNLFNVSWALHEGYKDVSEKLDGKLNIRDLIGKVIGVEYPTKIYSKIKMRRVEL